MIESFNAHFILDVKMKKSLWKVDSGYMSEYLFSNAFLVTKSVKKRQTRQKLNLDLLARLDNRQKWCFIWKCQFVLPVLFITLKQLSECLNDPNFWSFIRNSHSLAFVTARQEISPLLPLSKVMPTRCVETKCN